MSVDMTIVGWFIALNAILTSVFASLLARGMRRSMAGPAVVGLITGFFPPLNYLFLVLFVVFGKHRAHPKDVKN